MAIPIDGPGSSFVPFPGITHELTWSIDPATYNDAEYAIQVARSIVNGTGSAGTYETLATVPTTQSSYTDEHPFYVVGGIYLSATRSWWYRIQLIRLSTGAVEDAFTFGPVTSTVGRCSST